MINLLRPMLNLVFMLGAHTHTPALVTSATAAPIVATAFPSVTTVQPGPQPNGPSVTTTINGYTVTYGVGDVPGNAVPPSTIGPPCSVANAAVFVWCPNYDGTW